MGSDNFTGIVKFNCIRYNKHMFIYSIIEKQCPKNYTSLEHFKKNHDLNNIKWTTKLEKVKELAKKKEELSPTHHGIITIDYTNAEPLVMSFMYGNELKQITTTHIIICSIYKYLLYFIYIIFMLKLLSNLYY
jgi:hypothetical protein